MTAREFRKLKEENKLTIKDLAEILMQSQESVYAKLRGTRIINNRDQRLLDIYNESKKQSA